MTTTVLPYYAIYVGYLLLIFAIGHLVKKLLFKSSSTPGFYYDTFSSMLTGMVVFVATFAMIKSGFRTVNIGFLLFGAVLLYENRQKSEGLTIETKTGQGFALLPFLALLAAITVFFVIGYLQVHKDGQFPFVTASGNDYAYYGMLSRTLAISGYENKFIPDQMMKGGFPGITLFHFFDMWQAAGISLLTNSNSYLVYALVGQGVFLTLLLLGILSLLELYFTISPLMVLVAFMLLAWGHLHLPLYNRFYYLSKANYRLHHFGTSVINLQKIQQVAPFAFAACYHFLQSKYRWGLLLLLAIPLIYMSALPVLVVAIPAMLLLNFHFKWINNAEARRIFGYVALIVVFFGLTYKLFGTGLTDGRDKLELDLLNLAALKTRINIFGLTVIQTVAMYIPHLLVLALVVWPVCQQKEQRKKALFFLLFMAVIYVVGLGGWTLTFKNEDGMQLLGNNFPIINALLLSLMLFALVQLYRTKTKQWAVTAGAVLLGLVVTYQMGYYLAGIAHGDDSIRKMYSDEFLTQVSQTNTDKKDLIGVFLKGDKEYLDKKEANAHVVSQSYMLSWYLALMPQYLTTVSITVFDIPMPDNKLEKLRYVNAIKGLQFYEFVEGQKKANTFVSVDQSQIDFIKQYHITYAIASSSAKVSPLLMAMVSKTIVDPVSGERFMLLNN